VRLGIEELYAAYQSIDLKQEDLEGTRYLRIKHISKLIDEEVLDSSLRWTHSPDPID